MNTCKKIILLGLVAGAFIAQPTIVIAAAKRTATAEIGDELARKAIYSIQKETFFFCELHSLIISNQLEEICKKFTQGKFCTLNLNCPTGTRLLAIACEYGLVEIAAILLGFGANPNNILGDTPSPFKLAATNNNAFLARVLVHYQAIVPSDATGWWSGLPTTPMTDYGVTIEKLVPYLLQRHSDFKPFTTDTKSIAM